MNMREFTAYLEPEEARCETNSERFNEQLSETGFELQPLVGTSTEPSWKRTRKIGGVTIEDFIDYCSGYDGGYGRLRHKDPGLATMLNYRVRSTPSEGFVKTPPQGKEGEYTFIRTLGLYRPKINPNETISDADWEKAVNDLRRDISDLFELYDESQIQRPHS